MIHRHTVTLPSGNLLQFFINDAPKTGGILLVVDLVSAEENGGNELVRKRFDEGQCLEHLVEAEYSEKDNQHDYPEDYQDLDDE